MFTIFTVASVLSTFSFRAGASKDEPTLSFPVISDIHVQSWHQESQDKFAKALQDLHSINPHSDALIINGDLTNGQPADYKKLKAILKDNPHPKNIFYTIGNHEFYKAWIDQQGNWNPDTFPNGESEEASIKRFLNFSGEDQVYYDKFIKGYHFIFLGSEHYRQSDPNNLEDAYLSKKQLNWLSKTLKKGANHNKPIFVFLHQPLPYTVSGTSFCCVNNRAIIQHEELKKILSKFPQVFFFSGHTHWELKLPNTVVQDTFTMVNSSSVVQLWTDDGHDGEKQLDSKESEGLYVEVFRDNVEIKGRDFYRSAWIDQVHYRFPLHQK